MVHLHISVDPAPCIGCPVLTARWELFRRVVQRKKGVDNTLGIIGDESCAQCIQGIRFRREPDAVEEVFVCAFAEDESDIAGE